MYHLSEESQGRKHARVSLYVMFKTFEHYFQIPQKILREAIWVLYHPNDYEREFVSLFSAEHHTNEDDLHEEDEIAITSRGLVMVYRIMQTPEYWSRLLSAETRLDVLTQSTAEKNASVLHQIATTIFRKTLDAHVDEWYNMCGRSGLFINSDSHKSRSFEEYAAQFALYDRFYLERVAASHGRYGLEILNSLLSRTVPQPSSMPRSVCINLIQSFLVPQPPTFGTAEYEKLQGCVGRLLDSGELLVVEEAIEHTMTAICFYTIGIEVMQALRNANLQRLQAKEIVSSHPLDDSRWAEARK